ncbi:zinc-dependent alcohol dehydrogenase [Legionella drozanskii]|uniref:Threonine(-3-)dehydrogenase n=1 Tax=Legionella drozanskii LLAP-1 TaxID=1212489 RepID=A0A0W0SMW4_9GAMM|nr:zinc-binding alcohol dehydrogenase [Legionella drozanskii]KTC84759.1 threonine(-3-)dehydrogenase [Legionella drozanskii LLAP-1]
MKNHVLYFNKPNQVSILEESIPQPKTDELLIQNIMSGISSGTEMLFYRGLMPHDLSIDEIIPSLNHQLDYPFKYGYCSVGKVIETGNRKLNHLLNKLVFVFNPHESYFCAKEQQIIVLPEHISPHDALFIPNMETATNLILDGAPLIGENVLILGLGIVGLLTMDLLQQFPLTSLLGIDLYEKRRSLGMQLGAEFTFDASQSDLDLQLSSYLKKIKQNQIDLIYELSGNPAALNTAISFAAYEGRIVLGSWYGRKPCSIDLGGRFHRNRIKLIASQVSTIASELQGRWTKERRFEIVFKMLEKIKPSRFISHNFHISDANKAYQLLDSNPNDTLFITLNYKV